MKSDHFFRGLLIAVLVLQVLGILQIIHLREMNDEYRHELDIMEVQYIDVLDGLKRMAKQHDREITTKPAADIRP